MRLTITPDAAAASATAAGQVAAWIGDAIRARGGATLALSGGQTPGQMLEVLRSLPVRWAALQVFQVDERVAPPGDERRNSRLIEQRLCLEGPLPAENFHAMPVEDPALDAGAARYAALLARLAGDPPILDVAQLGIGSDGHTASLVPGDALLDETRREVGVSAPYQGLRRMSLTFAPLNRARNVLWLATGEAKAPVLRRLAEGDRGIPAGRVSRERALVVADAAAAAELPPGGGVSPTARR